MSSMTSIAIGAYSILSEAALPLSCLTAWRRGGPLAAWHTLSLGHAPRPPDESYVLWVHGASMGETLSALPVVRRLLQRSPDAHVVITASTPKALTRLEMEELGARVHLQHKPADAPSTVRRFLRHWRPDGLVLIESELWPNLLVETQDAGVPIALVNARISERSLGRWRNGAPALFQRLLSCCTIALAQSPQAARRLEAALSSSSPASADMTAGPTPSIQCLGDLKRIPRGGSGGSGEADTGERRERFQGRFLHDLDGAAWVAASTHPGAEEKTILAAHAALRRSSHPDLLLLIAPRHVERGPALRSAAEVAVQAHVALRSTGDPLRPDTAVYVCDTLGELPDLYSNAGVAFVGGSLVPLGGHSLLEAAQADGGCAVLHGPHMDAVEEAALALAATAPPAARIVRDAQELQAALDELLADGAARRAKRAAAAQAAAALAAGVLDRVWDALRGPLALPEVLAPEKGEPIQTRTT